MSPLAHFYSIIAALVVLVIRVSHAANNSTEFTPIAVAPSQYWYVGIYLYSLRVVYSQSKFTTSPLTYKLGMVMTVLGQLSGS